MSQDECISHVLILCLSFSTLVFLPMTYDIHRWDLSFPPPPQQRIFMKVAGNQCKVKTITRLLTTGEGELKSFDSNCTNH